MSTIPPEVPAGTDHFKSADEINNTVRASLERIEGFAHPAPDRKRRISALASGMTEAKLNAVANACDVHPELVTTAGVTSAQFRDGLNFIAAYDGLRKKLEMDLAALTYAVNSKRADLAVLARRVYQMAASLNQPAGTELLIPDVTAIGATFKRKKRVTTATKPPVTTTPPASTPPVTTQPVPPAVPAATTAPAPAVVKV